MVRNVPHPCTGRCCAALASDPAHVAGRRAEGCDQTEGHPVELRAGILEQHLPAGFDRAGAAGAIAVVGTRQEVIGSPVAGPRDHGRTHLNIDDWARHSVDEPDLRLRNRPCAIFGEIPSEPSSSSAERIAPPLSQNSCCSSRRSSTIATHQIEAAKPMKRTIRRRKIQRCRCTMPSSASGRARSRKATIPSMTRTAP